MKRFILMVFALGLIVPLTVRAADFRVNDNQSDPSVTVSKTDVVKNLYTAGSSVTVNSDVLGDLVVAGSDVYVNGDTEQSVTLVGNSVTLKGNVGQNARLGGNIVTLSGNVKQDLLAAANTLRLDSGSEIFGDAILGGSSVHLEGKVDGSLKGAGSSFYINGTVIGDVNLASVSTLEIGDNAVIDGNLTYSSNTDAKISSTAKILGKVEHKSLPVSTTNTSTTTWVTTLLLGILGSLLVLFLLVYWTVKPTKALVGGYYSHILANIGIGLAVLFAMPIVLFIAALTVVGLKLVLLLFALYILLLIIAASYSSLLIGDLIRRLIERKPEGIPVDWLTIVIGVLVSVLLRYVPFVGWLIIFVFFLLSLGSVSRLFYHSVTAKE